MQRFVIGTGRCGSTLLTNMLSRHPDCLILSEFLGALERTIAFEQGDFSAAELVALLQYNQPVIEMAVHRGNIGREVLYEQDDYQALNIPAICLAALPAISDQPDRLFGEIIAFAQTRPTQSLARHYLELMEWLQQKLGKSFWVERSGSSIEYLPDLYAFYPDARYLHIHRNGPDSAISMHKHFYFQVLVSFFFDPPGRAELLQTEIAGARVTIDDPVSQRIGPNLLPLEKFAEYWSHQLEIGYHCIAKMRPEQYLELRFEDLIEQPAKSMMQIAEFFEMPAGDRWIAEAAAMVDPSMISSSAAVIAADQREAVAKACLHGEILLGRKRSPGIYSTLELIREIEAGPTSSA